MTTDLREWDDGTTEAATLWLTRFRIPAYPLSHANQRSLTPGTVSLCGCLENSFFFLLPPQKKNETPYKN